LLIDFVIKIPAMNIMTIFRPRKYSLIKKVILLFFLLGVGAIVVLQTVWAYHKFESGLGTEVAETAIAYHVVLLLVMIAVGIWLGRWVDRMIRQKRSVFRSPPKGSWAELIMNLWGYELRINDGPTSEIEPISDNSISLEKSIEPCILLDPPSRRGRKPTFTLDRWLPIAAQWENRDPIRDGFTLGELIAEHLGTNPDGSPIVSEQAYYSTWRARAIEELRRRAETKKSMIIPKTEKGNVTPMPGD
jgi:hypothetical protein